MFAKLQHLGLKKVSKELKGITANQNQQKVTVNLKCPKNIVYQSTTEDSCTAKMNPIKRVYELIDISPRAKTRTWQ